MLSFLANTNGYFYNQPSAQHASITTELLLTRIWNLGIIFNTWNCSSHTPRHAYSIYLNAWPGNVLFQFALYCLKHNCYNSDFTVSKIRNGLLQRTEYSWIWQFNASRTHVNGKSVIENDIWRLLVKILRISFTQWHDTSKWSYLNYFHKNNSLQDAGKWQNFNWSISFNDGKIVLAINLILNGVDPLLTNTTNSYNNTNFTTFMAFYAALQSPSCKASYVMTKQDKSVAFTRKHTKYYIPQQHISVGDFKDNSSAQS